MTTALFIRHAECDHGVRDDRTRPLMDRGRKDAVTLATRLEHQPIDAIYSSPYDHPEPLRQGLRFG